MPEIYNEPPDRGWAVVAYLITAIVVGATFLVAIALLLQNYLKDAFR